MNLGRLKKEIVNGNRMISIHDMLCYLRCTGRPAEATPPSVRRP